MIYGGSLIPIHRYRAKPVCSLQHHILYSIITQLNDRLAAVVSS